MYKKLSEVYDNLIKEDIDYDLFIDWIISKIKRSKFEVKSILEIGCGTGNITIPLGQKGYKMTGVDISDEMLSVADAKAFEVGIEVRWINSDIVDLDMDSKFECVISTMDTFNYITDIDDLCKSLGNVYNALKPGGIFIFDINTKYRLKEIYGSNSFNYVSDEICYIWNNYYNEDQKICEFEINFFLKDEYSDAYERFEEIHYQRAYEKSEIVDLLKDTGFTNVQTFDFLSFEKPADKSEKIHFYAQKKFED
ncbi:class I SAM-dependent DNA methyltransferase [Alkalibacter mobilis]|uniref:class I SAM-dependent DNA methyltransferase n=1 Tax=Alkalibacter mobilis TaxID=2787712 RepID=UPI00189EAAE7|nr:class I SAM-dependent methyltransferase [Alkalibacter mobilis]MBF7097737.1 class I SAM-dependent methyltransferase [Alkalibacter mobilis]